MNKEKNGSPQVFAAVNGSIVLLLALGLILRCLGFTTDSLWLDELLTYSLVSSDTGFHLFGSESQGTLNQGNPPLYFVFVRFWCELFGYTEATMRLPSLIWSTASLYLIYLLGCRIYNHQVGFVAAALCSISATSIFYAQEARSYSLLLFLVCLASLQFHSLLETLRSGRQISALRMFSFGVVLISAEYTHYFGALFAWLIVAGLVFSSLWFHSQRLRVSLLAAVVAGAFIPWLYEVSSLLGAKLPWDPYLSPHIWVRRVFSKLLLGNSWITQLETKIELQTGTLSVVLGIVLAAFVLKIPWQNRRFRTADLFLIAWFFIPLGIAWILCYFGVQTTFGRYMIISLPALMLALARGVSLGPKSSLFASVVLFSLFAKHLVYDANYYSRPIRDQNREALQFIADQSRKNTNAVFLGCRKWQSYYFERTDFGLIELRDACRQKEVLSFLSERQESDRVVWYSAINSNLKDAKNLQLIEKHFARKQRWKFRRLTVWRFSRA